MNGVLKETGGRQPERAGADRVMPLKIITRDMDVAKNQCPFLGRLTERVFMVIDTAISVGQQQDSGNVLDSLTRNLLESASQEKDIVEESTNYACYSILVQTGTAMLAQANQTVQDVLKLVR